MLCTGYYDLMNATLFNTTTSSKTIKGGTTSFSKSYDRSYSQTVSTANYTTSSTTGFSFFAGTGSTPAAVTDYKLENVLDSSLVNYSLPSGQKYQDDQNKLNVKLARTFTNVSDETQTITELGVFYAYSSAFVLLSREVLNEPIVLEPGESITIQATLF